MKHSFFQAILLFAVLLLDGCSALGGGKPDLGAAYVSMGSMGVPQATVDAWGESFVRVGMPSGQVGPFLSSIADAANAGAATPATVVPVAYSLFQRTGDASRALGYLREIAAAEQLVPGCGAWQAANKASQGQPVAEDVRAVRFCLMNASGNDAQGLAPSKALADAILLISGGR